MTVLQTEESEEVFPDRWEGVCSTALDNLEAEGVNIQCINSSEFVVGRQTNFNCPVTIINCTNTFAELDPTEKIADKSEIEKIVIRDKILSESAATTMQEMARKEEVSQTKGKKEEEEKTKKKKIPMFSWVTKDFLKIPVGMWIIFLQLILGLFIVLTVVFLKDVERKGVGDAVTDELECTELWKNDKQYCIYAPFREEKPEANEGFPVEIPVPFVVVSQTNQNHCYDVKMCMEATWQYLNGGSTRSTPACNFLVSSEGNLYEDRGWNASNSLIGPMAGKSILLCFMGRYKKWNIPTYPQVESAKAFIEYGIKHGYIKKDYVLVPTEDLSNEDEPSSLYKLFKKWPNFNDSFTNETILVDPSGNSTEHVIYSKQDWGGKPARSSVQMKLPVPYVVVSHSVTGTCHNLKECAPLIRNMQGYHLSINFADLSYNFLVDSGGNIYESRGWKNRNAGGGFVDGRSIDINFIGDYSVDEKPTKKQFDAVKYLIRVGVENGKISSNYSLVSANATYATLSPGKNVYAVIKTWPHFDPDPKKHVKDFDY